MNSFAAAAGPAHDDPEASSAVASAAVDQRRNGSDRTAADKRQRRSNSADFVELAGGILLLDAVAHARERVDLAGGRHSLQRGGPFFFLARLSTRETRSTSRGAYASLARRSTSAKT